ncbi:hypothetical protein OPQ81_000395 [Rhizoctonia solani]|nr:hypothetical protein OPQ81_000395 [Rhizoctonia solani]
MRPLDDRDTDNLNKTPNSSTPGTLVHHPRFFFDNVLMAIQLAKSEVFSDMFNMPKPQDSEPEEGSSPEHPIVIKGVAASDFAALLTVLYARYRAALIVRAFRLANMFDFSELRAYLLPLAEEKWDDMDKILFARDFNIKDWLVPAYVRLCKREGVLSMDEARKLDVDGVLLIWRTREQYKVQNTAATLNVAPLVWAVVPTPVLRDPTCATTALKKSGKGVVSMILCLRQGMAKESPTTTLKSRAGSVVFVGKASNTKAQENPAETSGVDAPEEIVPHPQFFLDNTLIAVQIEKTLFNVHKYQLAKSEFFSDMFKKTKAEDDEPEAGSSPEHPIVIKGVAASDFGALLKVLYASHFSGEQHVPETHLIIPAFRIAHLLDFTNLRSYLLPLAEQKLDDIDKIVFSREFDIKEWLEPAHVRLCQREKPLNTEEARKLGVDSVLILWRMREQYQGRILNVNQHYCYSCAGLIYTGSHNRCTACGGSPAYLRCDEPSRMVQNSSSEIAAGVKKWVEENYVMKD